MKNATVEHSDKLSSFTDSSGSLSFCPGFYPQVSLSHTNPVYWGSDGGLPTNSDTKAEVKNISLTRLMSIVSKHIRLFYGFCCCYCCCRFCALLFVVVEVIAV